jgi:hypothetical protein
VVHQLRQRLAADCLPVFRSDGLNHSFYALTAHFGYWVAGIGRRARQWHLAAGLLYGQVKKQYRHHKIIRVTYVMRCSPRDALRTALVGLRLSGRLNTAFVERLNLTIRHSIAALARRTWATLQETPQLLVHLECWRAYYHFVRPHGSLRQALRQPIARGAGASPNAIASEHRPWPPA